MVQGWWNGVGWVLSPFFWLVQTHRESSAFGLSLATGSTVLIATVIVLGMRGKYGWEGYLGVPALVLVFMHAFTVPGALMLRAGDTGVSAYLWYAGTIAIIDFVTLLWFAYVAQGITSANVGRSVSCIALCVAALGMTIMTM